LNPSQPVFDEEQPSSAREPSMWNRAGATELVNGAERAPAVPRHLRAALPHRRVSLRAVRPSSSSDGREHHRRGDDRSIRRGFCTPGSLTPRSASAVAVSTRPETGPRQISVGGTGQYRNARAAHSRARLRGRSPRPPRTSATQLHDQPVIALGVPIAHAKLIEPFRRSGTRSSPLRCLSRPGGSSSHEPRRTRPAA
jgi:hypothetical protein